MCIVGRKAVGHLRLRKLLDVIEKDDNPDAEKNAEMFAELVRLLDDKSLSLISYNKRWAK